MPTIVYIEPETGIKYSLTITESEANGLSSANPRKAQRIELLETGGSIDFDDNGVATITSQKGQHSYANSTELVRSAGASLQDDMN